LVSAPTSFTVTPDATAPVSTATCGGVACSAGWYTTSPVSVALAATDGGSGLDVIRFTTDGTTPTLLNGTTYAAAFGLVAAASARPVVRAGATRGALRGGRERTAPTRPRRRPSIRWRRWTSWRRTSRVSPRRPPRSRSRPTPQRP